jgi:glycerophosphoryl diester phosphodiesterase
MKLPFTVKRRFRIIAHRGASAYAPENTMASFNLALEMGIQEIEFDVQLSNDGEVVICHDLSLKRYGYEGLVENKNWSELSELDMGSWFSPYLFRNEKLVRLQGLFKEYGSEITYHIEIKGKSEECPNRVCQIIENSGLGDNVIITSFAYETLKQVRLIAPSIRLGWLAPNIDDYVLSKSKELEFFQICPRADSITEKDVQLAHSVVPEVRAWGINGSREEILALIQKVIDVNCDGATIDWPDWISHQS